VSLAVALSTVLGLTFNAALCSNVVLIGAYAS
jgi:hypothetical protein